MLNIAFLEGDFYQIYEGFERKEVYRIANKGQVKVGLEDHHKVIIQKGIKED